MTVKFKIVSPAYVKITASVKNEHDEKIRQGLEPDLFMPEKHSQGARTLQNQLKPRRLLCLFSFSFFRPFLVSLLLLLRLLTLLLFRMLKEFLLRLLLLLLLLLWLSSSLFRLSSLPSSL
ncbi:hypothetical protein D0466_17555 [Peribacillus glennii]|uniref:Uncharacterized protein n=1 Tax=Peribacillus glennii TaxID=2303991 RepID=A0A372L8B6_9BACI|nr:hypothetical protein D0466_17555 [Peribacillus glennii]